MGQERYSEERTIEPGNKVCTSIPRTGGWGSRLLRLALPRALPRHGGRGFDPRAPAFNETTGKAHWDTLIRARAIENLAYVIARPRVDIT